MESLFMKLNEKMRNHMLNVRRSGSEGIGRMFFYGCFYMDMEGMWKIGKVLKLLEGKME
jgi:hypothetical protein